jgi:hypothetical protein
MPYFGTGVPTRKCTGYHSRPGAAKRVTIARMSWHHIPKDDAWNQAHLAMLVRLGNYDLRPRVQR